MGMSLSTLERQGATMSSTMAPHIAYNCMDDVTNNMCHTANGGETDPWVSIEVPVGSAISWVVLHHRKDCCQGSVNPHQVWIGGSPGDTRSAVARSCGFANSSMPQSLSAPGDAGHFAYRCVAADGMPLIGSHVTVMLPGQSRTLHLAEIRPLGQRMSMVQAAFAIAASSYVPPSTSQQAAFVNYLLGRSASNPHGRAITAHIHSTIGSDGRGCYAGPGPYGCDCNMPQHNCTSLNRTWTLDCSCPVGPPTLYVEMIFASDAAASAGRDDFNSLHNDNAFPGAFMSFVGSSNALTNITVVQDIPGGFQRHVPPPSPPAPPAPPPSPPPPMPPLPCGSFRLSGHGCSNGWTGYWPYGSANQVYVPMGTTQDGRPWYRGLTHYLHIFYDFQCGGSSGGTPPGWLIGCCQPRSDLQSNVQSCSMGGGCCNHANHMSSGTTTPPIGAGPNGTTSSWYVYCNDNAFSGNQQLTLTAMTPPCPSPPPYQTPPPPPPASPPPTPATSWGPTMIASAGDEDIRGMMSDYDWPHPNAYVVGSTNGALDGAASAGRYDAFVSKRNGRDGSKNWTVTFGTGMNDHANAITSKEIYFNPAAMDLPRDVCCGQRLFVAGSTEGNLQFQVNHGQQDAFLTRRNASTGTWDWTVLIGSPQNDVAWTVSTKPHGDPSRAAIYVGGDTFGSIDGQTNAGGQDGWVSKRSPHTGALMWTVQIGTPGEDSVRDIGWTYMTEDIFVVGYTTGNLNGEQNAGGQDAFVARLSHETGSILWTRLLGTSANEQAHGVYPYHNGFLYVAGFTGGSLDGHTNQGTDDAFLAKFQFDPSSSPSSPSSPSAPSSPSPSPSPSATDGRKHWTKLIGSPGVDRAYSVSYNQRHNQLHIAGYTTGNLMGQNVTGGKDAFLSVFSSGDGTHILTQLYGSTADEEASSVECVIHGTGAFVAGFSLGNLMGQSNSGARDGFLLQYVNASSGGP